MFGKQCGFLLNHSVALYTSPDLSAWTPHPPVFEIARDFPIPATMFSPKVLYNDLTRLWVLWFNYNPLNDSRVGQYGVATSASPYGPFAVVVQRAQLINTSPSDSALWKDPDSGQGYIMYSGQFQVVIEALAPDYLSALGKANYSGPVGGAYDVEAPALFRRNGTYYASTGPLCCYCKAGSAAVVYTATHPLGPYTRSSVLSAAAQSQQTDITRFINEAGQVPRTTFCAPQRC